MSPQESNRFCHLFALIAFYTLVLSFSVLKAPNIYAAENPLIQYARMGDHEMIEKLLSQGTDVNVRDKDGRTALMHACWDGFTLVVRKLLAAGADVNAKDKNGITALHVASLTGRTGQVVEWWSGRPRRGIMSSEPTEIVRMLIERGSDVNAKTTFGGTALMEASFNGHTEIVKVLLKHRADVNAKNNDGQTALMFAKSKGHTEVERLLQQAGAR